MLLIGALVVGVAALMGTGTSELAPGTVPTAYAGLILRYGSSCASLTPARLAAQLYQESKFDPVAVSNKGAIGIAQFLPATWSAHGFDASGDGRSDPRDPDDAIPSAAVYDCSLAADVAQVPGDAATNMLAAYNAGPYAVIKANGVPPFTETRQYVTRIHVLELAFTATIGPIAPSQAAAAAVTFAYGVLGTPYKWGGNGTSADKGRFDCSGLSQAAYRIGGVPLARLAHLQWYSGAHIPRDQLAPGDLVFFAYDLSDPNTIHHVGIYVGDGYMIDAPHTGADIRFDPIDQPDYIGAVRPIAAS
jgi:cell wall-associated NlpC family hydrolase